MKKRIVSTLFIMLTASSIAIGSGNTYMVEKDVLGAKKPTRQTMFVDKKHQLKVNAKSAKWSSTNKKIAVVSNKGVVTLKKPGKATIIAKVGNKKLSFPIISKYRQMYATDNCKIRKTPSNNGKYFAVSYKGMKLNYMGDYNSYWAKIRYKNKTCYFRKAALSATDTSLKVDTTSVSLDGTTDKELAKETFYVVNDERKKHHLKPLVWDKRLEKPAKIRAAEASVCWGHIRPNGKIYYTVSDLVDGENLAKVYKNSKEVVKAWMDSPGHRKTLLTKDFSRGAIYIFINKDGYYYWCNSFGY